MLCLWSDPARFNWWISLVFSWMYCWVLTFALSPFYILIRMYYEIMHLMDISCEPNIYMSWSTTELKVRLVPLNIFKPSSIVLDHSKVELLLWILFDICVSCLPYWDRADLFSLLCVKFPCVFFHFSIQCPRSGLVLDCTYSRSLPSSLLWCQFNGQSSLVLNIWVLRSFSFD